MLGHAALALPTVLAPQRGPNHARNTEIGLVKLPQRQKVINDGLLLGNAIHLGHKAWIVSHARGVEEGCETCKRGKRNVEEKEASCFRNAVRHDSQEPISNSEEKRGREDSSKPRLR